MAALIFLLNVNRPIDYMYCKCRMPGLSMHSCKVIQQLNSDWYNPLYVPWNIQFYM